MINAICMANPIKSKNPLYQDLIIAKIEASNQKNDPNAVVNVSNIANTKAFGINFKNRFENNSPNFSIIKNNSCFKYN